jgi:hypothetical protein
MIGFPPSRSVIATEQHAYSNHAGYPNSVLSSEETLRRACRAFNAREIDAATELMHPNGCVASVQCNVELSPNVMPYDLSQVWMLSINPGSSARNRSTCSRTSSASTSGEACSRRPSKT